MITIKTPQLLFVAVLLLTPEPIRAQGTFPPPSAPGVPVMKTLSQVEPRTPIQSLAVAAPYTITQSGSYYLTGNIIVSTDISPITVVDGVDDVTIDLNGFTIESTLTGLGSSRAIFINSSARIRICNGNIKSGSTVAGTVITGRGFSHGIYGANLADSTISGVHVAGMYNTGIYIVTSSLVENCNVSNCTAGIVNLGGTTRQCLVTNCSNSGIQSTLVEACQGTGFSGFGISCTSALNSTGTSTSGIGLNATTATNCTGTSTSGHGLNANTATNCTGTTASTTAGVIGLRATGTANTCRGISGAGATALKAAIAIGCTIGGGILDVPVGKSFNM